MFSSSSRPIPPYGSITPRPILVGSIRSRSGFPKSNAMSSLGDSSLLPPTSPESLSVTSGSTTKPPHPSAGDLRMPIIALNQSLNEPLTHCTSLSRYDALCWKYECCDRGAADRRYSEHDIRCRSHRRCCEVRFCHCLGLLHF